ncbi:hypothetical protein [Rhodococcus rhodnii]|nr:hypothetical protein [Rhodococcus rhodnii]
MQRRRLRYYLEGGRPKGGAHAHPGARDHSSPTGDAPLVLPGALYFAGESRQWTGGRAFYDPDGSGTVLARAYLVTEEQFADIRAQEPACYDRVLQVGERDGFPMYTFTTRARADAVRRAAPASAYLDTIRRGVQEAHGWDDEQAGRYLGACVETVAGVR